MEKQYLKQNMFLKIFSKSKGIQLDEFQSECHNSPTTRNPNFRYSQLEKISKMYCRHYFDCLEDLANLLENIWNTNFVNQEQQYVPRWWRVLLQIPQKMSYFSRIIYGIVTLHRNTGVYCRSQLAVLYLGSMLFPTWIQLSKRTFVMDFE